MPVKEPNNQRAASRSSAKPIVGAIFTIALFAIGTAVFLFGKNAIVSEYYEYHSRHFFRVGSLGFEEKEGFRILEGPEAIYWGLAFCALGVMFGLWGCGVIFGSLAKKKPSTEPSAFGRGNAWLSFITLLVAILCLFPPWRSGSIPFYLSFILGIGSFLYPGRGRLKNLPEKVFPGLIIAAVIAGNIRLPSVCASIVIALIAMFFAVIHVLILAPQLMKLKPGGKERAPSGTFDD